MASEATHLQYAVRGRVLLRHLGTVAMILAALQLVPGTAALLLGIFDGAARYGVTSAALLACGYVLSRIETRAPIQRNEAMVLAAVAFVLGALASTWPMAAHAGLSPLDAFFEAVSGVTTTGLSTAADVESRPKLWLFSRAWLQWCGGLGVMVFAAAFVLRPGVEARRLSLSEGSEADDLAGGTRARSRRILQVYCALTGAGILLMLVLGASFFDAIVYTLAAISTGGFAPHNSSLSGLGGIPLQAAVTLLCVAGSTPVPFLNKLSRRSLRDTVADLQVQALMVMALALTAVLTLSLALQGGMDWGAAIHHGAMQAFSAQSTAGFSSMSLAEFPALSKLAMIFAMLVGGGVGSTAGGFKILRLLIALKLLQILIRRSALPAHAVLEPKLGGRRLSDPEIEEALLLIGLFVGAVLLSWLAFLAYGYDPLDSLFEVASATGTVGLSVGLTGADLPAALKGVLCADMLLGRLEIVVWLVTLYPGTWIGRRTQGT